MAEQKIVKIDARAAGYDGQAVRVMAVTMVDTGKILLAKLANWQVSIHAPVWGANQYPI